MFVENRNISIKIFNLDGNINIDQILNEISFPLTTENYTYGIFNETKIGKRLLLDFVCLYQTAVKTVLEKDGKFYIDNGYLKKSSLGKFSIMGDRLELFSCDNIIKGILENEFGNGQLRKFIIPDNKYLGIYNNCSVKSSESYILKSDDKKYKINVFSNGLNETSLNEILQNPSVSSTSFSGRIIVDREIAFKLNKNGNIMLYNNQKNLLTWEDIFKFLDRYIY